MPMFTEEMTPPATSSVIGGSVVGQRSVVAPLRCGAAFDAGPVPAARRDVQRTGGPGGSCARLLGRGLRGDVLHRDADPRRPRRCDRPRPTQTPCGGRSRRAWPPCPSTSRCRPRGRRTGRCILERFRQLRESPDLLASYLGLLREVWAPVDDTWQQALPVMQEAGRHVVAQYERGRSLETLIPAGCDILRERMPDILSGGGFGSAGTAVRALPVLRVVHVPGVPRAGRDRHRRRARATSRRGPARNRSPGASRPWPTRPVWRSCTRWRPHRARWASWRCCSGWPSRP